MRIFFLYVVIQISFSVAWSATPKLKFYHLTSYDGLSQSTVNRIIHDSDGFMWFATNDGLNKFDGYEFTIFRNDPEDQNSIGIGRVLALCEDSNHKIWAGTEQGGLNCYDKEKDRFIHFYNDPEDKTSLSNNYVTSVLEDKKGNLWIGTYGGGLNLYDPGTNSFRHYRYDSTRKDALSDDYIRDIFEDSYGNIWIATYFGGVNCLITSKMKFIRYRHDEDNHNSLSTNNIITIYEDNNHNLWFGTYGKGAIKLDKQTGHIINYLPGAEDGKHVNHSIVRAFGEDNDGNLWIGTGGGGINMMNLETGKIHYEKNQMNNTFSLNTNIIYDIYKDENNIVWIGTFNGGINYYNQNKDKFTHYKSFGQENSLSNNAVLCFAEDVENNLIYIGTDGGGVNVLNNNTGKFSYIRHNPNNRNSISGDVVTALCLDHEGILWIGTYTRGLNRYDPKTGYVRRYIHDDNDAKSVNHNDIWYILEDGENHLWIATLGGGLDLFDRKTNSFIHHVHHPKDIYSLSDNNVATLFEDSDGNIWIGTEHGGVNYYDKQTGHFFSYKREQGNRKSLGSNQVRSIFEDSQGNIWIGTEGGGLNLFIKEKKEFKVYRKNHGLPNDAVYAVLEDEKGNLWISTNKGVCKFLNAVNEPLKPKFKIYDIGDGLQAYEFSYNSSLKSHTGKMYFGGMNGFNVFHPADIKDNLNIPQIVFTDFKIANKSQKVSMPGSPLNKHISKTSELKLSYKDDVISFEFAALDYTVPEKNQYAYMLENFDTGWVYAENERSVTYTNLDPGKYILHVRASNNDQIWNNEGIQLAIYISPPFTKTIWFKLLLLLFASLLLYVIYYSRVQRYRRHRILLKTMVDERTQELTELNNILEERSNEIQQQREELITQKENLIETNKKLESSQRELQLRNEELAKHRNHLEDLVKLRTLELEKAKEKAEESDRLKMSFLSNMSHEIRTPMNAIIGFSSLLNEPDISDDERRDFTKQININGEALLVLIDDILDLSKIEANQLHIRSEKLSLNNFIDEIYDNWTLYETKDHLEFRVKNKVEKDNIYLISDKYRIRQILVNLLDNAFKFTNEGYVELGVNIVNNHLLMYVRDTGVGISEEFLNIIFERFFKGIEDDNKLYRGTGLGLAISKRLAELLGGRLWAESKINKGTTFYFEHPLAKAKGPKIKEHVVSGQEVYDFSNKNVLIVEDEENNYLFLKGILKKTKVQITWSQNGLECVDLLKENDFDAVLMDIKMPVMNGYEAAKLIKKFKPDQIIIAQTAFARSEDEERIRNAGFTDYISKPIKPRILINMLGKYLQFGS